MARLISLVEDGHPALREVMAALSPDAGHAHVVGLTGSPGVGKSTATSALVTAYRSLGRRVGVLAVDPSSPFSGGALLGDRIRMSEHTSDPEVFIRSMASRGHLGGLSRAAPQALRVLDAAGCDVVLLETVGVGQSEVEVAGTADTTVVVLAPGMGDGIQAAKAGILEVADVLVVNKADRDGAARTASDLSSMVSMADGSDPQRWTPPVVSTIAHTGGGHRRPRASHRRAPGLARGRRDCSPAAPGGRPGRSRRSPSPPCSREMTGLLRDGTLDGLAAAVAAGRTDPYSAADRLAESVRGARA